jgi:phosphoribosylformylglycinamidine synthase
MLSPADLAVIRARLGREPTDLEGACFENLWSEHCSYRSTKRLLSTLPTTGPQVIVGPGDDAAVVRFNDTIALAVGMESHNHPSYVDPHDGAATGVGGIVRDVLSMGARPVALMDPLYFGPLTKEKNRHLLEHVVSGIGGYGNCIGVPVVRGDLAIDPSYDGNPLVNVVCIGLVDPDKYVTGRVKSPGSHLVLLGASTGRDGLGGASFASRDLARDSVAQDRPSVQIGDPFTEKLLIEAVLSMVETGRVLSCRDLGAAGLAGASSEMCSTFGGRIAADRVHQRETGMHPVEVMLAESQERMLLEVAPEDVQMMGRIAARFDLPWSDIGNIIKEPRYIVTFHGEVVCDLPIDLLTAGAPQCSWEERTSKVQRPFSSPRQGLAPLALQVLAHPEVASKEWISSQYDHDVQIKTVSITRDAAVLCLGGEGLALSCGCNPRHVHLDPHSGTANAVAENASNLACVGASPIALVNCLNFANPTHPEVAMHIREAVRGMGEMARALGIPVVGGNVSLYNESAEHGTMILPTPSIGIMGKTPLLQWHDPAVGDEIAIVGTTGTHFGGSLLDAVTGCGGRCPPPTSVAPIIAVRERIAEGARIAATDLSQGGLIAALASWLPGAEIALDHDDLLHDIFSETYGRFLVTFRNESAIRGLDHCILGEVKERDLVVKSPSSSLLLTTEDLQRSLSSLTRTMRGEG